MKYSHEDIVNNLEIKKKHIECDVFPLAELKALLEDGWVIYDTRPAINTNNVKYLTLVKS